MNDTDGIQDPVTLKLLSALILAAVPVLLVVAGCQANRAKEYKDKADELRAIREYDKQEIKWLRNLPKPTADDWHLLDVIKQGRPGESTSVNGVVWVCLPTVFNDEAPPPPPPPKELMKKVPIESLPGLPPLPGTGPLAPFSRGQVVVSKSSPNSPGYRVVACADGYVFAEDLADPKHYVCRLAISLESKKVKDQAPLPHEKEKK